MIYTPALIHDFRQLKTLFTGKNEIAEIAKIEDCELVRPRDFLYYDRWHVALILISAPLATITYLFLKTIATILWSYQIDLLATRVLRPLSYLDSQWNFGSALWVPTINEYALDLTDLVDLPSVRREEIPDPFIREKLHKKLRKVNFSRIGGGVCWGACHWFTYLLLKKLKTEPIEKVIVAVAKQFEYGQPRQAALLQSFYGLELDLLDLQSKQVSDWKEDGIYLLESDDHCVIYVRDEGKVFVWDPKHGLLYPKNGENLPNLFPETQFVKASWINKR